MAFSCYPHSAGAGRRDRHNAWAIDATCSRPASNRVSCLQRIILFQITTMVRGIEGNEMSTPRSSQKKQPASAPRSGKNQKSILGFFQKQSTASPKSTPAETTPAKALSTLKISKLDTPQPSSDPAQPSSPIRQVQVAGSGKNKENGLRASTESSDTAADQSLPEVAGVAPSSPSRKVCRAGLKPRCHADSWCQARKTVNYAESDDDGHDDDDDVFKPIDNGTRKGRATKRRRLVVDDDSDDNFELDEATQQAMLDDGEFAWSSDR